MPSDNIKKMQQAFEAAQRCLMATASAEAVQNAKPEAKLKLYALYKQATCGDCPSKSPLLLFADWEAFIKQKAWLEERGLSQNQAMLNYIDLVCSVLPHFKFPINAIEKEENPLYQSREHVESVHNPQSVVLEWITTQTSKLFRVENTAKHKQSVAVALLLAVIPSTLLVYPIIVTLLLFPLTCLPVLIYLGWLMAWDDSAYTGKRHAWLKSTLIAKRFVGYFPISLTTSADAASHKPVIYVYHPHGIIGLGSFGCFATTFATQYTNDQDIRLLTLDQNFYIPLVREILLGFGICSCSKQACNTLLRSGKSICLLVGGAREALETRPGQYRFTLDKRGFVRVAIENNTALVPVIGFGENDAFDTLHTTENSTLRQFQRLMQHYMGFTLPIFWGQSAGGLLPKRNPIHAVVGNPVVCSELRAQGLCGEALVDAFHHKFVCAVRTLFDQHKNANEAGRSRSESLIIL